MQMASLLEATRIIEIPPALYKRSPVDKPVDNYRAYAAKANARNCLSAISLNSGRESWV